MPHLENLDPLLQAGWKTRQLFGLPQAAQDKIRETTFDTTAPYEIDKGYKFPDRIVVGVVTK